jgi:hypothetical protein
MIAVSFAFTTPGDGLWIGAGLICVEARYCSRLLLGGERIDRLHSSPTEWREIEAEIGWGLSPGPVPTSSVIARTLLGGATSALVRYLHQQPVNDEPERVAVALDALLQGVAAAVPESSSQQ